MRIIVIIVMVSLLASLSFAANVTNLSQRYPGLNLTKYGLINSNASHANSILCKYLGYCPKSSTTTIPVSNSTSNQTSNQTTALNETIEDFGTATQTSASPGQYIYHIVINRTNTTATGIYSFALLGHYGNITGHAISAYSKCSITINVTCTATFIVGVGVYNSIEVINNGNWLYALKLSSPLTTPTAVPLIIQKSQPNDIGYYLLIGVVSVIVVLGIGNYYYDYKMTQEHPEAYYVPKGMKPVITKPEKTEKKETLRAYSVSSNGMFSKFKQATLDKVLNYLKKEGYL